VAASSKAIKAPNARTAEFHWRSILTNENINKKVMTRTPSTDKKKTSRLLHALVRCPASAAKRSIP
jgi:hypothetical protein